MLERLSLIALGRAAGFSLEDISGMLDSQGRPQRDPAKLLEKADELDQKIRRLTAMRNGLRHAAHCPAPSWMECPNFRRIVKAAGAGRLEPGPRRPARPSRA